MKRRILTVLFAALFAVSAFGGAFAAQDDLGVQGEPNCHGQRMSYHASGGDNGVNPARGTPAERAEASSDYDNAGEINKAVRGICGHQGNSGNAPGQNK